MGLVCAQGLSVAEAVRNMFEAPRPPAPPSRFETPLREYPVFDVEGEFLNALGRDLDPRRFSRTVRIAAAALEEALVEAGLAPLDCAGHRVALVMGTTVGVTLSDTGFYRAYREGKAPDLGPYDNFAASNPALALAELLGIPVLPFTVVNACASSSDAVGLGKQLLESGAADLVLAGGADEVCEVNHTGFASLLIYSKHPCSPFDLDRQGLNLGTGAAMLVLEREEDARARGRVPSRWVAGYGTAQDGHHMTAPHPEADGLRRAVEAALREGGVGTDALAFVNAHGTATKDNDLAEGRLFARILPPGVPVVSTKGYTGHTLGAAGALEAVLSMACLRAGRLMPSGGYRRYDAAVGFAPSAETRVLEGEYALSTSLGFGGSNAALLLRGERS
jgi:3-oxoacyl-[acyl-carrier-protein] synthase-1/3-oxoacyl-[acyl-carrier-protein] synthase II